MPVTVREFLENLEAGTLFIMDDIDTKSSRNSIKTQLSQECRLGKIERVLQGIYYKPYYNETLGLNIPYGKEDLAYTIARMNNWHIIPDGDACLNMLGLSTQVPARYAYLSDGPYKIYKIGKRTIEFRHRTPKNYPKDDFSAMVVQAIKAQSRDYCDWKFIKKLSQAIPRDRRDSLIENTANTSVWIRNVIRKACVITEDILPEPSIIEKELNGND